MASFRASHPVPAAPPSPESPYRIQTRRRRPTPLTSMSAPSAPQRALIMRSLHDVPSSEPDFMIDDESRARLFAKQQPTKMANSKTAAHVNMAFPPNLAPSQSEQNERSHAAQNSENASRRSTSSATRSNDLASAVATTMPLPRSSGGAGSHPRRLHRHVVIEHADMDQEPSRTSALRCALPVTPTMPYSHSTMRSGNSSAAYATPIMFGDPLDNESVSTAGLSQQELIRKKARKKASEGRQRRRYKKDRLVASLPPALVSAASAALPVSSPQPNYYVKTTSSVIHDDSDDGKKQSKRPPSAASASHRGGVIANEPLLPSSFKSSKSLSLPRPVKHSSLSTSRESSQASPTIPTPAAALVPVSFPAQKGKRNNASNTTSEDEEGTAESTRSNDSTQQQKRDQERSHASISLLTNDDMVEHQGGVPLNYLQDPAQHYQSGHDPRPPSPQNDDQLFPLLSTSHDPEHGSRQEPEDVTADDGGDRQVQLSHFSQQQQQLVLPHRAIQYEDDDDNNNSLLASPRRGVKFAQNIAVLREFWSYPASRSTSYDSSSDAPSDEEEAALRREQRAAQRAAFFVQEQDRIESETTLRSLSLSASSGSATAMAIAPKSILREAKFTPKVGAATRGRRYELRRIAFDPNDAGSHSSGDDVAGTATRSLVHNAGLFSVPSRRIESRFAVEGKELPDERPPRSPKRFVDQEGHELSPIQCSPNRSLQPPAGINAASNQVSAVSPLRSLALPADCPLLLEPTPSTPTRRALGHPAEKHVQPDGTRIEFAQRNYRAGETDGAFPTEPNDAVTDANLFPDPSMQFDDESTAVSSKFVFVEMVAAIVIQTAWRRYVAMVQVDWMLCEQQRQQDAEVARRKYRMYYLAAVRIQSVFRGFWVRDCQNVDHYCCTVIQKAYRRRTTRMQYLYQLYCIVLMQAVWRRCIARQCAAQLLGNVVVIQAYCRGHLDRLWIDEIREQQQCAPPDLVMAATMIQARWRAYVAETAFIRALVDVLITQSVARRWLTIRHSAKHEQNMNPVSNAVPLHNGQTARDDARHYLKESGHADSTTKSFEDVIRERSEGRMATRQAQKQPCRAEGTTTVSTNHKGGFLASTQRRVTKLRAHNVDEPLSPTPLPRKTGANERQLPAHLEQGWKEIVYSPPTQSALPVTPEPLESEQQGRLDAKLSKSSRGASSVVSMWKERERRNRFSSGDSGGRDADSLMSESTFESEQHAVNGVHSRISRSRALADVMKRSGASRPPYESNLEVVSDGDETEDTYNYGFVEEKVAEPDRSTVGQGTEKKRSGMTHREYVLSKLKTASLQPRQHNL